MDELYAVAQATYYPLVGSSIILPVIMSQNKIMAGFGSPNLWGPLAFLEWLTALNLFVQSTQEAPMSKGFTLMGASWFGVVGVLSYRRWKNHDDDDRPRKRVRTWIKTRVPRVRALVPVKG